MSLPELTTEKSDEKLSQLPWVLFTTIFHGIWRGFDGSQCEYVALRALKPFPGRRSAYGLPATTGQWPCGSAHRQPRRSAGLAGDCALFKCFSFFCGCCEKSVWSLLLHWSDLVQWKLAVCKMLRRFEDLSSRLSCVTRSFQHLQKLSQTKSKTRVFTGRLLTRYKFTMLNQLTC